MGKSTREEVLFISWVYSDESRKNTRLMVNSLRSFGGAYSQCPVWIFVPDARLLADLEFSWSNIEIKFLDTPESIRKYNYGHKVYACAKAEEKASQDVSSLVWVSPEILFINPPVSFDLVEYYRAAFRPVHIQNVGLRVGDPLDLFWKGVYRHAGVSDIDMEVESFVDRVRLRAYFNSAAFAVNPGLGYCRRWLKLFEDLVTDEEYQHTACQDEWHRVFLHQAVLSALVASVVERERLRLLSPDYIYPYNLHNDVHAEYKARSLDELVCLYSEGRSLNPKEITDIEVPEPYRSWLAD